MSTPPLRVDRFFRRLTLLITAGLRIAGVVLAFKAAQNPAQNAIEFGVAAFMMSGAEGLAEFAKSFFGKLFEPEEDRCEPDTHDSKHPQ